MGKRDIFTKILAILGTVFVWFPILAPILFSVATFARARMFRFDYLMPAELFPAVLIGGGLLLWAAFRARSQKEMIGWGLGVAVGLLVAGQVLAVVSGLASGAREPTGFWWGVVLGSIVLYVLAVIVIGVGGVLLLRDLFKPLKSSSS
jgi:hypothetical protein